MNKSIGILDKDYTLWVKELVKRYRSSQFEAPDGKQRFTDVLDSETITLLAKHYPKNRASEILDWFIYSDDRFIRIAQDKAVTMGH